MAPVSLAAHYAGILHLHVACVAASGGLFAARGVLRLAGSTLANQRAVRISAYLIDTSLLVAAILLALTVRQYPLVNAWLTVKLLLLLVYIGLGLVALRLARSTAQRCAAYVAALAVYLFIIGVAVTHHPAGWLTLI
jgi:uncharacterized membrane protein SirB2